MTYVITNGKRRTVVGSMRPDGTRPQLPDGPEALERAFACCQKYGVSRVIRVRDAARARRQLAMPRSSRFTGASWLSGHYRWGQYEYSETYRWPPLADCKPTGRCIEGVSESGRYVEQIYEYKHGSTTSVTRERLIEALQALVAAQPNVRKAVDVRWLLACLRAAQPHALILAVRFLRKHRRVLSSDFPEIFALSEKVTSEAK